MVVASLGGPLPLGAIVRGVGSKVLGRSALVVTVVVSVRLGLVRCAHRAGVGLADRRLCRVHWTSGSR